MKARSKSQGFTQIPNHIFKNANWTESKFDNRLALIDLYRLAQFQEGYVIKKGRTINLKPGQVGWSQKKLAERWQWSNGKVRRFLNNMKTVGEINIDATSVSTTITLLHWVQNIRTNGQANEHSNGNQIDTQSKSRRHPNNTVNTEKKEKINKDILKLFKYFLGDDNLNDVKPTPMEEKILKEAVYRMDVEEWKPHCDEMNRSVRSGKTYKKPKMKFFFESDYGGFEPQENIFRQVVEALDKRRNSS